MARWRWIAGGLAVAIGALGAPGEAAWAGPAPEAMDLRFELRQQLPLVAARVDGRDMVLMLDLGGAAELALRADVLGASPSSSPRRVELPGLPPLTLVAQAWRKAVPTPGVDGYLGYGYLKRHSLVIDYPARVLRLLPAGIPPEACQGADAVLRMLGSLPTVQTTRHGQPFVLGLDTGANQNVLKAGAVPGAAVGQPLELDGLALGDQALATSTFRVIDLQVPVVQGLLGHDFFARHRVCLDPAGGTLRIEPVQPAQIPVTPAGR